MIYSRIAKTTMFTLCHLRSVCTMNRFGVLVKHVHHALWPLLPSRPVKVATANDLRGVLAEEAPPHPGNPHREQHGADLQDECGRSAQLQDVSQLLRRLQLSFISFLTGHLHSLIHYTILFIHTITTGVGGSSVLIHLSQRHHLLLQHPPRLLVLHR